MAPPYATTLSTKFNWINPDFQDEIIVSGLSGRYPGARNVNQLRDNLYNKTDPIGKCRWNVAHPDLPTHGGVIDDIGKLDSSFFGLHPKQMNASHYMLHVLMEKTFEAIVDAGFNPKELKGKRVGVILGLYNTENEFKYCQMSKDDGSLITGSPFGMIANRISYWLGVNGPSCSVDSACSSSIYALERAYNSIESGECDSVIVGSSLLCFQHTISLQYRKIGVLNMDGKCKCFDENANGYTRSEAAVVVYLQKAKDARRIYAQIIHAKTNCDGYKSESITFPSRTVQSILLKQVYAECGVKPADVEFVEAHGTGTRAGDPEEVAAIESVFCTEERKTTLLLGSVKSNIGHSEPTSGLCSLSKLIIVMENGYHVPNLHFNQPREDIKAICDGRIKVVTDVKLKYNDGYLAFNSFGFGGANGHVLLKPLTKHKDYHNLWQDNLPRLVCFSGRTEEAIQTIADELVEKSMDLEFIGLLHEVFKFDIPGHLYRGYTIRTKNKIETSKPEYISVEELKPLWLFFYGPDKNFIKNASNLIQLPIFTNTLEKCHRILSTKNINLNYLFKKISTEGQLNLMETFVVTTSIQISLIEIIKNIDLRVDKVTGYSIGELACAYYDKCLSLEQTLLCSYYLGQACEECNDEVCTILVEAPYEKINNFVIDLKLINYNDGNDYCMVLGATNQIRKFCNQLKSSGILYKTFENLLYWVFTTEIENTLTKHLKNIIKDSRKRTEKWLSNSGTICSPEFIRNICTIPSTKTEFSKIHENIVRLEITTEENVEDFKISLLNKKSDGLLSFLTTIGQLYIRGYNSHIQRLYPPVKFPVSRGTPMLSPLIKWDYSRTWNSTIFAGIFNRNEFKSTVNVNLRNEEFEYLKGHVIDGRILYPATGYLNIVLEALCEKNSNSLELVVFENVRFHRATHLPQDGSVEFTITIQECSGKFEIIESGTSIVTGIVYTSKESKDKINCLTVFDPEVEEQIQLSAKDIYKELRLRGYNYKGSFRGLHSCNTTATRGRIHWKNSLVPFMDNMLQMFILHTDTRELMIPVYIERMIIDRETHAELITTLLDQNQTLPIHKQLKTITSGGIEICNMKGSAISRKKLIATPVLETYRFIPNIINNDLTLNQSLRIILQLLLENISNNKIKIVELLDLEKTQEIKILSTIIQEIVADIPLIQADLNVLSKELLELNGITVSNKSLQFETECSIIIVSEIVNRTNALSKALSSLIQGGFLLTRESLQICTNGEILPGVEIILDHQLKTERLLVLKRIPETQLITKSISLADDQIDYKFEWLPILQSSIKQDRNTLIYAQNDNENGIIGFINCIRKEPEMEQIRCVFIQDSNTSTFDLQNDFYTKQLKKGLAVNVYKNGQWGTYRHVLLGARSETDVNHAYVNVTIRGELSSLKWLQTSTKSVNADQQFVHIYYSALNFRDIMTATGRIFPDVVAKGRIDQLCVQGLEFSGRLENGTRVMGASNAKSLATDIISENDFIWQFPDEWSLEDAATVPIVYVTVLFALVWSGKIKKGMSVLIHSGAGGVGQAAINIALHFGCTVYTTVGSIEKREFIKQNWPEIKDNQIGNSHDTSFEEMIKTETKGRGVDLLLNSLAEDKLIASVRCLAHGGKFLEIGKFDLFKNNTISLEMFKKEASYHGIMLDEMFTTGHPLRQLLHQLMDKYVKSGAIKPLHRCVFQKYNIEEAFRFMAAGKHVGKVLIEIRNEESKKLCKPSPITMKAIPQYTPTSQDCYIMSGGLGGFGLEIIDWLILRGAQNFLITSRQGITTGYQAMRLRTWKSYGTEIIISTQDITTYTGCKKIIEQALELGPIEAIFNLAVVLRDSTFENQTPENFQESFGGKAIATKHFDRLSREMCPELKKFVVFSSVSCGRGNAGQTNYGMANSVMERICEQRQRDGFPALAIQWGAVGDVGLVAEMQENDMELVIGGTLQQRIASCLTVLDQFLTQDDVIVSSMVVAEKKLGTNGKENLVDTILNILGITDIKTINPDANLVEIGMDSIVSAEIKQIMERDFDIYLTTQDLKTLKFSRLQELATTEISKQEHPQNLGLNFFNILGDEANFYKPYIKLTQNQNDCAIMLPGIEGMAAVMENLAKHLTINTICLQYDFNNLSETIQSMADSLIQTVIKILEEYKTSKSFTIIGYSYGCLVALELAKLLELNGRIGRLILIDGAPKMLKDILTEQTFVNTDEDIQNAFLFMFCKHLIADNSMNSMKETLHSCTTWDKKVNIVMPYMAQVLKYDEKYYRIICKILYNHFKSILKYEPENLELKSTIKLIRATDKSIININDDYDLSKYTKEKIEVVYVEGNHVSVIQNLKCAEEINKLFE